MKKNLDSIAADINKLLTSRDKEKADFDTQINKLRADISKLDAEMEKAVSTGNDAAYVKLKREKTDLTDRMEICKCRLDNLQNEPLVSEAEYNEMLSNITTAGKEIEEEARTELAALAELMESKGNELARVENRVNDLLHTVQDVLFKGNDRRRDSNGQIIRNFPGDDKRVSYGASIVWSRAAVQHYQYTICKK